MPELKPLKESNQRLQLEAAGLWEEFGHWGCDTVDHMADAIVAARHQIAALEKERDGLRAQLVQVATGGLFRLDPEQEVDCDYSFGSEASCRK